MMLIILFWLIVFAFFVAGIINVVSSNAENKKRGKKLLITATILFIIGFGSCIAMLSTMSFH